MAVMTPVSPPVTSISPIVVDLGKRRRKLIRQLKRGQGKLMNDVAQVMDEVRANLGPEAEGKELVPVVIVYQRKRRRKAGGLLPMMY